MFDVIPASKAFSFMKHFTEVTCLFTNLQVENSSPEVLDFIKSSDSSGHCSEPVQNLAPSNSEPTPISRANSVSGHLKILHST